jgi:GNAT superfamily N-acetyltransferase
MRKQEPNVDGPRACREQELPELLDLVNYVFRTMHGRPPSIATDYPQIYNPDNLEYVRIIKAEGRIRASVGMYPSPIICGGITLQSAGINCTTTHPDWRRRGFGGMIMRDAYRTAKEGGADIVHLSPGVPEWYRKYDLEYGGNLYTYHLDRGNVDVLPALKSSKVDAGLDKYGEQIHDIHRAERIGNLRTFEQTKLVLPRVPAELYVAQEGGTALAYLFVREDNHLCIEHGGPPDLVAGLLREVFHRRDEANQGLPASKRDKDTNRAVLNPRLELQTNPQHAGLVALLDGLGIPVERKAWHMIYLTDPQSLPGKLGLDHIRVAETDDQFVVESGGKRETFSRLQLTKLFFGPERISDIAGAPLPIPIYTPNTDHV